MHFWSHHPTCVRFCNLGLTCHYFIVSKLMHCGVILNVAALEIHATHEQLGNISICLPSHTLAQVLSIEYLSTCTQYWSTQYHKCVV